MNKNQIQLLIKAFVKSEEISAFLADMFTNFDKGETAFTMSYNDDMVVYLSWWANKRYPQLELVTTNEKIVISTYSVSVTKL